MNYVYRMHFVSEEKMADFLTDFAAHGWRPIHFRYLVKEMFSGHTTMVGGYEVILEAEAEEQREVQP